MSKTQKSTKSRQKNRTTMKDAISTGPAAPKGTVTGKWNLTGRKKKKRKKKKFKKRGASGKRSGRFCRGLGHTIGMGKSKEANLSANTTGKEGIHPSRTRCCFSINNKKSAFKRAT